MQPGIIFIYSLGKEFETFSALSTRRCLVIDQWDRWNKFKRITT